MHDPIGFVLFFWGLLWLFQLKALNRLASRHYCIKIGTPNSIENIASNIIFYKYVLNILFLVQEFC